MSRDLSEVRESVLQKYIGKEFPGIAKNMFHVFAKQQETDCKASGRTVGDSFYRDRAKMRGLILPILYSETDRSECRMVL